MSWLNNAYFKFRHYFSTRWPKAYEHCNRRKGVIKFVIAGCLAGGSDLVFLFLFHGLLLWGIVISTSIAFILSFLVSFTLQKFWTFRNYHRDRMFGQLCLYLFNAFIGLNLNGFLMHLLVYRYQIWYLLAQVIVSSVIGLYNFVVYKFIVFKKNKNEIDCA